MATVIDATVGTASATSYGSVAEADAYLSNQTNNIAWVDADDDTRAAALNRATARIDAERYRGAPATDTQALKFPRIKLWDDGRPVDSSAIPRRVKQATFEQTLDILNSESDTLGRTGTEGIKSVKAGTVSVEFRDTNTPAGSLQPGQGFNQYAPPVAWDPSATLAPQAWRLLRDWILTTETPRRSGFVRLVKG